MLKFGSKRVMKRIDALPKIPDTNLPRFYMPSTRGDPPYRNPFYRLELRLRAGLLPQWEPGMWIYETKGEAQGAAKKARRVAGETYLVRVVQVKGTPYIPKFWPNPTSPDLKSLYRSFHGANPKSRKVKVPTPGGSLLKIGRLTELNYRPEAPSRRAGQEYFHRLGDTGSMILPEKPILATDGKNLYIIPEESRTRFTERGIIG